ncbi:Protein max [Araneus ventricosus]|uniref:Protein max n=1 Tax=Araneus ventricosus TaxID=182803 RepID=A0A4Y2DVD7_ARAVE|nr:Protein max [Araneus ventricosus]
MSEDERYIDNESDADKRAHHNALERKRRDHIKDSFSNLRDSLPAFQGDKVRASRAQILKKAADYIQSMRRKNISHQQDIDDLKKQNKILEDQIKALEKAKTTGNYVAAASILDSHINSSKAVMNAYEVDSDSDASSDTDGSKDSRRKKFKSSLENTLRA